MRRKDREVKDIYGIREIIRECDCCRLAFPHGKSAYIVPLSFGYNEAVSYTHLDVYKRQQYTIVIVTHNIAQARRISDYAAFLFGGRLVEWGESEQLFGCPVEEETRAFLAGIYG